MPKNIKKLNEILESENLDIVQAIGRDKATKTELRGAVTSIIKVVKETIDGIKSDTKIRLSKLDSKNSNNFINLSRSIKQLEKTLDDVKSNKGTENLINELSFDLEQVKSDMKETPEIPEVDLSEVEEELKEQDENIKKLEKEIEDLRGELKNNNQGRGVHTGTGGLQQQLKILLKTEAPSGDIDGVNDTYTVKHGIFAIFAFSLNGEVIAQIPNYTISGNSVIFSTALPSAYSGKDFEIKYI